MTFKTKLTKTPLLSVFSFVMVLLIFGGTPHLCFASESPRTTLDSIPWTTIEPIPKPAPKPPPAPAPDPASKPAPESEPPAPLSPETINQLGACFGGCQYYDENCKLNCFNRWQKSGGR